MPLRDHFLPPLNSPPTWEGVHGLWPALLVMDIAKTLPPEFVVQPRIHHGPYIEIDVAAFDRDSDTSFSPTDTGGGVATALWTKPALSIDTDLPDLDDYEILIHNLTDGRKLVAAVEIVSPANKDRPEHRRAFVAKCVAMIQARVSVAVVDLVTSRQNNLFRDVLEALGNSGLPGEPAPVYASACRVRPWKRSWRLDIWDHPLAVGGPLPTLPLWLKEDLVVPLPLDATYEETCRTLRIP